MVSIAPLRGLRPAKELASKIVSPPYDVLSRKEARDFAKDNPFSFLRIIRSDIEFPDEISPYAAEVYAKAKTNLDQFLAQKALIQEEKEAYYLYRLKLGPHQQTGVAALFSIEEYFSEIIKKHEVTRVEKERDRIKHIQSLQTHTGPVFLLYREKESQGLSRILDDYADSKEALYDLSFGEENTRHHFYRIDSRELIKAVEQGFADMRSLYIADGHHRAASAAQAARASEKKGLAPPYFLGVAFPDTQTHILPYYRLVCDLASWKLPDFLAALRSKNFSLREGSYNKLEKNQANMYTGDHSYKLQWELRRGNTGDVLANLAVNILQERIFGPLLQIADPRKSDRIAFMGGTHGDAYLQSWVQKGKYALAFSTAPIETEELLAIADAKQVMPPKSTWFEPKLRSGFLLHSFAN